MDAQGRGRGEEFDPADQWVLNPQTGEYELRLGGSAEQSPQAPGAGGGTWDHVDGSARPRRTDPYRSGPSGAGQDGSPRAASTPREGGRAAARQEAASGGRASARGQGAGRAASRKARKGGGKKKALLWTAGGIGFVIVAVAGSGYAYYQHLNGNIDKVDIGDAGNKDAAPDGPINILIIGTDKRTGKGNEGYGDKDSPGHADTNILLHVSADRTNATGLSIPRDLITNIPDCPTKQDDGSTKTIPGTQNVRFNTSLGQEGRDPGCTMRTVTELTGLKVDHFMMADFNAVKNLTTAVNGVEVCVAKDVDDPDSHLKLSAGTHKVQGEQALAFVRTRHSFGNQGDLDRIKVQQQFLGSLARQLKSEDTLTSPKKLYKVAEAATNALTVDSGIGSITKLMSLAKELQHINPKNITFVTLPVVDNPAEKVKATVVLNETDAEPLFAMMKDDVSLTKVNSEKKAAADKKKEAEEARLKGSKSEASDIRVEIFNGGAATGMAQGELTWLQTNQGVSKSSQQGDAPKQKGTTLEYSPDQAPQARKLAEIMGLPGSALKPGESIENDQGLPAMKLVLGPDFKGPGISVTAPKEAPKNVLRQEADKKVCAS
ncbi:LCP family protein [Streptomyces sp. NPDC004959]|uniref:LCP family protein n=1 Tax=unclassified Streptomyces TaxID=2593676 RepID=UPI0004C7666A|nr:LCP family protein [Streptomyces sp. NRRL F-5630]